MSFGIILFLICILGGFALFFSFSQSVKLRRSIDMVFLRVLVEKRDSDMDEKHDTIRDSKEQISIMEQLLVSMKALHSGSSFSRIF